MQKSMFKIIILKLFKKDWENFHDINVVAFMLVNYPELNE